MRYQIRLFFTAIMFYTRIPCPSWVDHSEEFLNRSTRYFPLVGWIVGGISALVFLAMTQIWSPQIAIAGSMLASIWLTGAFHEDGLADVCDGFGGGWTKEKILEIMKDSRLGTYGGVGLFFGLAMKWLALYELLHFLNTYQMLLAIVAGHSLSRWASATIIFSESYARADATSKIKPIAQKMTVSELGIASVFGLLPLATLILFAPFWYALVILVIVWIVRWWLVRHFNKHLEGYTGDCLGATQQITEIVFYLVLAGIYQTQRNLLFIF